MLFYIFWPVDIFLTHRSGFSEQIHSELHCITLESMTFHSLPTPCVCVCVCVCVCLSVCVCVCVHSSSTTKEKSAVWSLKTREITGDAGCYVTPMFELNIERCLCCIIRTDQRCQQHQTSHLPIQSLLVLHTFVPSHLGLLITSLFHRIVSSRCLLAALLLPFLNVLSSSAPSLSFARRFVSALSK